MPLLFISYRWDDDAGTVKLIVDRLKARLPQWEIFYDHESIAVGQQFPDSYRQAVTTADVVLVMIGPNWLKHLLDRRSQKIDHVRTEVSLALASGHDVVPITLGKAAVPTSAELAAVPEVARLATQLGLPIRVMDLEHDIDNLVAYLEAKSGEEVGTIIAGNYKLLKKIGEGGMGVVYLARSLNPKRDVAVKLIKPGMDSKEVLARFEAERQALAATNHPNIAQVLDAGLTSAKRPFFVMDYVDGVSITQHCDDKKLTPNQRLVLFTSVCEAVQHAHQKGILHRDIKPTNVLVEIIDGQPVPKVIDFGLAKALNYKLADRSIVSEIGRTVGTLEYCSPEQAAGLAREIDTRTDIYSLGALLYELLAGEPPFSREELLAAGEEALKRVICEREPPAPSVKLNSSRALPTVAVNRHLAPAKLTKQVRGELDWIVLKALEKEPERRYPTATSLAEDIQHYLRHEPISAGKPSTLHRLQKFVRRNRVAVVAAASVCLALLGGVISTTVALFVADEQRTRAEAGEKLARDRLGLIEAEKRNVEELAFRQKLANLDRVEILSEELGLVEDALECAIHKQQLLHLRLGPNHPETIESMGKVAHYHQQLGDHAAALSVFQEALRLSKAIYGPDDPRTIDHIKDLARGYRAAGEAVKSVECYQEVLVRVRANHKADGEVLLAAIDVIQAYRNAGQMDSALSAALVEAKALRTSGYASKSEAKVVKLLADLYEDKGNFAAAQEWREWLVKLSRPLPEDPERAALFARLHELSSKGKTDQKSAAIPFLADLGKPYWTEAEYGLELALLGHNLLKQSKWPEAEVALRECVAIREKAEPDAWTTFNASSLLGEALIGQKKYLEAEPLLLKGYEGMEKRASKIDPQVRLRRFREAVERLVRLYEALNHPDDATKWKKQLETLK